MQLNDALIESYGLTPHYRLKISLAAALTVLVKRLLIAGNRERNGDSASGNMDQPVFGEYQLE